MKTHTHTHFYPRLSVLLLTLVIYKALLSGKMFLHQNSWLYQFKCSERNLNVTEEVQSNSCHSILLACCSLFFNKRTECEYFMQLCSMGINEILHKLKWILNSHSEQFTTYSFIIIIIFYVGNFHSDLPGIFHFHVLLEELVPQKTTQLPT